MNFPLWFNSSSASRNFLKAGWMGKLKLYQWTFQSINLSPTLKESFTHMWFCNFQMLTNLIITMYYVLKKKSQLVISTLIPSRISFWILGKYKAYSAIWRFFKILIFDSQMCVWVNVSMCVCMCVCMCVLHLRVFRKRIYYWLENLVLGHDFQYEWPEWPLNQIFLQ